GKPADARVLDAADAANRFRERDSRLERVAAEVKDVEGGEIVGAIEQPRDRSGEVGQVGPSVPHVVPARIDDGAQRAAPLDEALAEPAVARVRAEEVARAHDED